MRRRIAHLSDLHFGRTDPTAVDALGRAIEALAPDLVVVSGDLTQRAQHDEFRAARAFLDALKAPWLAVPGNHDVPAWEVWERFGDPFGRWRRWIGATTDPDWHDGVLSVAGLNTARRLWLTTLDWSRGRIARWQMRTLSERFARMEPARLRVVVAHHPFLGLEDGPGAPLVGRADAGLAAFASAGVGVVLTGHLHRSAMRRHGEDGPLVVQAATGTSTRLRNEANAFNLVTFDDADISVQVFRLGADGRFEAWSPEGGLGG